VIVDGVGYPAVGSICGVSNAHIARALNIPVVLVGKSGVGDAVDSYNLNACFFEAHGVRVLGGIFNKLPLDGYYSLHNCKQAVEQYFSNMNKGLPYGFIATVTPAADEKLSAQMLIDACASNVDVSRLLADVNEALLPETPNEVPTAVSAASSRSSSTTPTPPVEPQQQKQAEQLPIKCRETIETEAYESGATTG
jgi:AAA domain